MTVLNNIIKFFIKTFCIFIKSNPSAKKYLFTVALRTEVIDFIENKYYSDYEHIIKSIDVFRSNFSLGKSFIILDIGGSTGGTALMYSSAFPDNTIYVFEPIKETYQKLISITKGRQNIIPINKAVGSESGTRKINIAKRISSSSLFDLKSDKTSKLFSDNLETVGTEEISICSLDNEISSDKMIGIIKIDVQGFELEVLKGALSTLERTSVVLLEVNNHNGYEGSPKYYDIDVTLRESGFMLYDIYPSTKDNGRLKEWDVIYTNKKYNEGWNN